VRQGAVFLLRREGGACQSSFVAKCYVAGGSETIFLMASRVREGLSRVRTRWALPVATSTIPTEESGDIERFIIIRVKLCLARLEIGALHNRRLSPDGRRV